MSDDGSPPGGSTRTGGAAPSNPELAALGERIELLSVDPQRVRSRFASLVSPILRVFGWEPSFGIDETSRLIRELQARGEGAPQSSLKYTLGGMLEQAIGELEDNVTRAERACVVNGYVPIARAAWLRRLYEVITRAARAIEGGADKETRRLAAAIDPVMILPPLAVRSEASEEAEGGERGDAAKAAPEMDPGDARLLELHLAAIDHLLDAARSEREFLGRRRRLLEASRKLLLETSAALPLDPGGVEARRAHIAEQIVRINRLEAAGVSPEVGLVHQARSALSRGDRQRLNATLGALDMVALQGGDGELSARTNAALRKLWGGLDPASARAQGASLERSSTEVLGGALVESVRKGYAAAREDVSAARFKASKEEARELKALDDYLKSGGEAATLSAALAVDGCFEVGGTLSPVRVEEHEERARAVAYPTQELMLVPALDVGDIPSTIIDDPRRILLSLAEGRLLARKFILREAVTRRTTRLVGEARVYLLDGSTSMLVDSKGKPMSARARMRDAILLAELATLHKRYLAHGRRVRVALYYRYFTRVLWPIVKVDSADSAMQAMVEVVRTPRQGGTDIEGALLASFELVREARASDPDLGRAQIVLVTDGDAPVREDVIRAARERVGDMPVGVSVIALGEENASLRGLVARQRARGERAFYHYIDDAALGGIAEGRIDRGPALHIDVSPSRDAGRSASEVAAELSSEVGELVDEIGELGKKRHASALDAAALEEQSMKQALSELGLPAAGVLSEGERARREALDRDRRALTRRFARWFPEAGAGAGAGAGTGTGTGAGTGTGTGAGAGTGTGTGTGTGAGAGAGAGTGTGTGAGAEAPDGTEASPAPGTPERADLDAITIALSTVVEVVSDVGGGALARQADAIEILERLLPDARLSPARYLAVVRAYPAEVAPSLRAVHAAVKPRSS